MSAVTASEVVSDDAQRDARRAVVFRYVLDTGETYIHRARYPVGTDVAAKLAEIGADVPGMFARAEIRTITHAWPLSVTLRHAGKHALLAVVRMLHRKAEREELHRLATALHAWITDGFVTNADLDTHWGTSTIAQRAALKTRIQTLRDRLVALQGEVGE